MNPYILLALIGAMAAAGAGGFKLGVDHQKAGEIDKQALVAEAVDAANASAAQAIAALRPKYTTIQSKVQHEVQTNVVYRDCKLSADGLLLANQALTASTAAAGGSKLSDADSVK